MPTKGDNNDHKDIDSTRQKPRRIFSFDSVKSAASSRRSSADQQPPRGPRQQSNPFDLSNVQEQADEQDPIILSPRPTRLSSEPTSEVADFNSVFASIPRPWDNQVPREQTPKFEPVRPTSTAPSRSFTPDIASPLPSTTASRWENLRQHVLPVPVRPLTPPQRPGSAQSSIYSHLPSRSTTPKPSRLARLGFKHVVEQAREVIDDTRKFGGEILRACATARYPEQHRNAKEREASLSSTTLTGTGANTSSNLTGKKLDYLRRPQSVTSLASSSTSSLGPAAPSLRFLYQILVYHSAPLRDSKQHVSANLPHENHVLSTLLCPFLTPTKYPTSKIEEEQATAMEAFELISKNWTPADEAATVERCLWCTKAASTLPPSGTRTRILGFLWRLLVPGDKNRILLTPQGFQTISNNLLLLLVSLYRSSTSSTRPTFDPVYANQDNDAGSFAFAPANFQQAPHPDIHLLQELIPQFLSGSLGELEDDKVEEFYGVEYQAADQRHLGHIRKALFLDSLVNCIERAPGSGEWLLCNAVEQYWSIPSFDCWTSLQAIICARKLNTFCSLSLSLLRPFMVPSPISTPATSRNPSSSSSSFPSLAFQDSSSATPEHITAILQSRVIPEAEALDTDTEIDNKIVLECRKSVVQLLLHLLCLDQESITSSPKPDVFGSTSPRIAEAWDNTREPVKWAMGTLSQWYRVGSGSPWKFVLEKALNQIILRDWTTSTSVLSSLLRYIPDDIKRPVFSSLIPILNDQLVEDPPPYPSPKLSAFLTTLSNSLPPVFFKPLFACAASDKEVIVVNHLCTLQVHSKYVTDYWLRDVEMMCVALMGDAGASSNDSGMPGQWGVARLGQLVLLVELIGKIQGIRHDKEAAVNPSDARFMSVVRYVATLENRLWLVIESKERTTLLPPSQRMLLCILFREFRLLTRSTKPAPWLSKTLRWFEEFFADEYVGDLEQEVTDSMERVQGLYLAAQEGIQQSHKRHTSMLAAGVAKTILAEQAGAGKPLDIAATFVEHRRLIDSLSKGYPPKSMKLFVAMSTLIAKEDYQILGPILWQHCMLDNVDSSLTASACFLLMQCAERNPMDLLAVIEVDMQTSDDTTRLEAVRKISILINWRFQIISQNFITDRTHRPFKLARPPLPFVATDMGTGHYVHVEDSSEAKDRDEVPSELRKRLAELGWAEEDSGAVDPKAELIKTPLSILPANQMDRLEVGSGDLTSVPPVSPLSSPQPSPRKPRLQRDQPQALQPSEDAVTLLRRNSSSGGPISGVKRKAVFVPPLTLIFPRLAKLVYDSNIMVASAARTTILDMMRNDPALLTRPILDYLSGENKDIQLAISTFSALLHIRRLLPPPLTHNIFNNLAGFLKHISRNVNTADALQDFGLTIPIMARIATQVSGLTIREIRRAKIEHFVIPSGSLWFSSSAPKGPMFPQYLGNSNDPFEPVPPSLISITMIRVSQNMMFLSMLKRNYQDVQVVRKNMSRLVLPSLHDDSLSKNLEIYDFIPRKPISRTRPSLPNTTIEVLSLMISRSYILLVAQIFRSMPRHLSDRHELAILIDGLNRTLVVHGDDINIVSQVLIALMVASTRFRRLFTAGGGYTLFMPALVKVYTERPSHPGIRGGIEYAISRFYALHKESFLYQSINAIGQIGSLPDIDGAWFSKGVFDLFSSLRKGVSASTVDVAGIHNVNKAEEREALIIHTADEKPQTFLAAMRRVESQTGIQMSFQLPDEYESARLSMDDFVRLFLTVIAHDLSISRAQHFLRLLRFLAPHLYNASASARAILADGIAALGQIFTKTFSKPKGGEFPKAQAREEDVAFLSSDPLADGDKKEQSRNPSDSKAIRLDFLQLILSFGASGGQVSLAIARQAIDIIKSLLKDWGDTNLDVISSFLGDFVKMLLHREEQATPKAVVAFLRELSPILHAYMITVDFTSVFETILKLSEIPTYATDPAFCQVVVGEICTAGLAACELAASENQLMTLQYRPILVSLLAEAIFLREVDIITELEKRPPTHLFLAGVILPLTMTMKTESQIIADGLRKPEHRKVISVAWIRILIYAMSACEKSRKDENDIRHAFRGIGGSFRFKSNEKGRQEDAFWRSHLPTFMTALQVIKVVIVRGAADISSIPQVGIWERLASFFKTMLADGSAEFALSPEISSTVTTPTGSPRNSGQFNLSSSSSNLFLSTSSFDISGRPGSSHSRGERLPTFYRPRIVDYSLWSMLEFICAYSNPLRTQLKFLMMEKVLTLDHELRNQGVSGGLSPIPVSPSNRRVSTSIFSKSRQRVSALAPSPESSPRLMPSASAPLNLTIPSPSLLEIPSRRPGYQISPVTPHDRPPGLPKIVHLGPVSPSAFPPISSPIIGAGGLRGSRVGDNSFADSTGSRAKTTKIKSLKLIKQTYKRVRAVQMFMGYDLLLPIPGMGGISGEGGEKDHEATLETWTKVQALAAISKETNDLLEEFEETFGIGEDSVMVDVDQTASFSSS